MLYFYSGTDREKARGKMNAAAKKVSSKNRRIIKISDANSMGDLQAALRGPGMFGESRVVLLEGTLLNEEMRPIVLSSLLIMRAASEHFFIFEEKPDANAKKALEKVANESFHFDAPKQKERTTIFSLANALRRADKKALWIAYQKELAKGEAPEAIHGVLFWAVKDIFLKSRDGSKEKKRASALLANLAELPHEARRNNFNLEYALERFILSLP